MENAPPGTEVVLETPPVAAAAATVDFEPPAACINRIVKAALPDSTQVTREAKTAFAKAAGIFIIYLTTCANDVCKDKKRQTVSRPTCSRRSPKLELEEMKDTLQDFLALPPGRGHEAQGQGRRGAAEEGAQARGRRARGAQGGARPPPRASGRRGADDDAEAPDDDDEEQEELVDEEEIREMELMSGVNHSDSEEEDDDDDGPERGGVVRARSSRFRGRAAVPS
ncbi:DNA-directed DNA polymerase [Aureococcus anophagefferens]|uniref:DNA-directed DNA polymerase n=1 Tax=Aureococcus anophagefferens TaxID=44056 RepID=A0ABR1FJX8_AURAN